MRADNTIDPASAVTVLDVPTSRGQCCHVGGDIDFDAAGNLYLSTGDDTNPFDSAGYAPLDERADRNPAFDAQRTSGNSNDLRGKVLRIKPSAAGGYTIPAGNMFAAGHGQHPARGLRDGLPQPVPDERGQGHRRRLPRRLRPGRRHRRPEPRAGRHRLVRADHPARLLRLAVLLQLQHPVPRVHVPQSGRRPATYNCAGGPTNNSRNNTGITTLPAVAGGLAALRRRPGPAGLVLRQPVADGRSGLPLQRRRSASDVKFPASYDGKVFVGEFGRRWIKTVNLERQRHGRHDRADFPWTGTQVMDMEFGPDGALYVLDYGTGWFGGDANSALYRIEYSTRRQPGTDRAASAPTRPAAARR